ncbi:calcium-binding protein [Phenylobacterium terrae]|uniref:Calcium-binding protein n=1 Tax=Phenylobacterium terrae TaxID=2665495 RepID=A0ABW4N3Q9_9CAUL
MASVPTRYVFYGGVEGVHQLSGGDLSGAEYGAAAFGFTEGAPITGELVFSGAAYETLSNSYPQPPLTATEIPLEEGGLSLFLQMPRMGPPLFGLTEDNLFVHTDPENTSFLIALPNNLRDPLAQLHFWLYQNEDGAGITVGDRYIRFDDDDNAMAEAYGVWMPENVKVDVQVGGAGADNLKGGEDWNFLYGLGGDDKLTVRNGEDGWAWGGTGNDTIKGADDADHLFGGWGNDKIDGGEGQDLIKGGLGNDTINAGRDDDIVIAGAGDDIVTGGDGGDLLEGNGGRDTLNGGIGEDFIAGGDGNDSIEGGGGDDVIFGGRGDDTLRGGGGADDFHLQDFDGNDRILNFQRGQDQVYITVSDPLDFQSLMATAVYAGGNTTLTYFQGATITFVGIAPGQLSAGDFVIS